MADIPSAGEVFRSDDGTVSTILPLNYGDDYEPSEEELKEYAEYIGIDPVREPELMRIAKEGLRAPLPDGWRACQTDENEVYYFNFHTGESLWDHPMDSHYKNQVINERARQRSGGGGPDRAQSTLDPALRPTATTTGSTKAVANSFFLQPTTTGPVNQGRGPPTDIRGVDVVAAPVSTTPSAKGKVSASSVRNTASGPRAPPDVSDILARSSATSRPSLLAGTPTTGNAGLSRVKVWEAALRKRLEGENEAQLRTLRIELEKKANAERQRLSEGREKLQREIDVAWEKTTSGALVHSASGSNTSSSATQRCLQLESEVSKIEESWKSRLQSVGTRLRELQQQVEEKQQAVIKVSQQSPEELRKTLEAGNTAEVMQLREEKKKELDTLLAEVKREQASELTKRKDEANDAVAAVEKEIKIDFETKMQQRREKNDAMLSALQESVAAKQANLKAKEQAAATAAATTEKGALNAAALSTSSAADDAAIKEAQAVADAEVATAAETSAAAVARLREEYASKKREKELAIEAAQRQRTQGVASGAASLSEANEAKLDEEARRLRDEVDRSTRIFEEETKLMVENKRARRPLTATPTAGMMASVSPEAIAALGRTANQEQRLRDAENTRHFMSLKQLEAKHDQAVRSIRAQLEKNLASAASSSAATAFNPRHHPSFTTQLTARKRAWLRDHPAPSVETPKLPPIPTLPSATLDSDMAAECLPSEEEQSRLIKSRLAEVREEVHQQYEMEVQGFQKAREKELETWGSTYRSSRLAEVQTALEEQRQAALAQAEVKAKSETTATSQITSEEERRLTALQSELRELETAIAAADQEHESQTRVLEESIAGLEASLAQLRTQERHTEEKKAEYLVLHKKRLAEKDAGKPITTSAANVLLSSSSPAAQLSSVLYISEEEAAAEVASLHARWTELIQALRAAVQQEMEAYGRALGNSSNLEYRTSVAEPTGTRPPNVSLASVSPQRGATATSVSMSSDVSALALATPPLPPPAPFPSVGSAVAAAGQPATLPIPLKQNSASSHAGGKNLAFLPGCATPLQRHLLEHEDSVACSNMVGAAVPRVSSSPIPRLSPEACLMEDGAHSGFSLQRSDFLPQHPHQRLSWPDASVISSFHDSSTARSQHRDPSMPAGRSFSGARGSIVAGSVREVAPSRGGDPALVQQMMSAKSDDAVWLAERRIGDASESPEVGQEHRYAARLIALQQAVRSHRHHLQAQRQEIEALRDEWRAEMHICKRRGDGAQASRLRERKAELEKRARQLNEEVLRLRGMHDLVEAEIRQVYDFPDVRQYFEDSVGRGGSRDADPPAVCSTFAFSDSGSVDMRRMAAFPAATLSSAKRDDVAGLLQSILSRTEQLEAVLLMSRLSTHSPSPRRSLTEGKGL